MKNNEIIDAAWELEKNYFALVGMSVIIDKIIHHKSKAKRKAEQEAKRQAALKKRARCVHYIHSTYGPVYAEYAAPLYSNGVYVKDVIIKEQFDDDPYGLYTEKEWRKE